jgi:ankyrin repeat protein
VSFTESEAHTCAAEICIAYLCSISHRVESRERLESECYLASYAAQYWLEHYRLAESKSTLDDRILEFFDSRHHYRLVNWTQLHNIEKPWSKYRRARTSRSVPSPVYYTASAGLGRILSNMLTSGASVNSEGGVFGYPLQVAAYHGHTEIVKQLLKAGAKVDARGVRAGTALLAAANRGHVVIVKDLLNNGADPNSLAFDNGTAIAQAAQHGHTEVVHLLLFCGADPYQNSGKCGNALSLAVQAGNQAICRAILEHSALDGSQQRDSLDYAAQAASQGHGEILELLFQHGTQHSVSILAAAAGSGNVTLLQSVLNRGASLEAERFYNPLAEAAASGSFHVVERLLALIVEVNVHRLHSTDRTALQRAAEGGHVNIVKTLLAYGAQKDIAGDY